MLCADLHRLVAVPEHHQVRCGEAATHPVPPTLAGSGVVDHCNAHTFELELDRLGEVIDVTDVVVAEHGVHGRPPSQLDEQLVTHHVAGVEHEVGRLGVVPHRVGYPFEAIRMDMGVRDDEEAGGHAVEATTPRVWPGRRLERRPFQAGALAPVHAA